MWYEKLLCHFKILRKKGDFRLCRCPAHKDRSPSLSVWPNRDGTKLCIRCYAGCNNRDILARLGLKMSELFEDHHRGGEAEPYVFRKREVAQYDYLSRHGQVLYRKVRYEPKDFRIQRLDENGQWAWGLGETTPRVLYNLPLVHQMRGQVVLVVGGEKDADRALKLGFLATCNVEGEGQGWDTSLYPTQLSGRDVIVIPDNDEAGYKHAARVAGAMTLWGDASSVKIMPLPDLPEKGDLSDFADLHGEKAEKRLRDLMGRGPRYRRHP
jgi:putative DNA primase/helicase